VHFRGSSDELTQKALAGVLLFKADMDTEHLAHVDVSTRRALQQSMLEISQQEPKLTEWIREGSERSAPDSERYAQAHQLMSSVMNEVGAFPVVQLFEEAEEASNPSDHIIETLRSWLPRPAGVTGLPLDEESRLRLVRRPQEVTESEEWKQLILARGRLPPDRLSSIYSVLMGLVLQSEGQTISEYTRRSNEIRVRNPHLGIKHVVPPSTIAVEFSQLKKLGWVKIENKRVYLTEKTKL